MTPAQAAFVVVRQEADDKFQKACANLSEAKQLYLIDPVEINLRTFTLALREAESATQRVLMLEPIEP